MDVSIIIFLVLCGLGFGNATGTLRNNDVPYDTIVVGLGASGVAAASTLARAGRRVLGLEAQNRVGGRVSTVPFGDGVVEMGAEWIHGDTKSSVFDLAGKCNVKLQKQNNYTDVLSSDGIFQNRGLFKNLSLLCHGFVEETPNDPKPLGVHVTERLKSYLKEKNPEVLEDKDFIEELLDLMNGLVSNYEAINDWNDVSTNSTYKELGGYILWSWNRNGYETLFNIMLNKYQDGSGLSNLDIKLNTEVVRISWPKNPDGKVSVQTGDGTIFTADNVIVTVSIGALKVQQTNLFVPPLPDAKVKAIERIPMGVLDKIIFSFPKPWWPNDKCSYSFLWKKNDKDKIEEQDRWVTKIAWATCSMGSSNVLTLWTSGENGKFIETLPEAVIRIKAMELLQKFMGANLTIPEPTGMIRTTWFANPYTRGSYSYDDLTLIQFPQTRDILAQPLLDEMGTPRVLFAGEATEVNHFSTVHGAVDSGYREAFRLLSRVGNQPTTKI